METHTSTLLICIFGLQLALSSAHTYSREAHRSMARGRTNYYPKYRHDFYYDSRNIPEDVEMDVHIHRNHPQKFYFMLESGYSPLSVTVTPCSSRAVLEWKISHSFFQGHSDTTYRSDTWTNHVLRPPSASPAAAYTGTERRSYSNPRAPPGTYTLELRSNVESKAKILVTSRPTGDLPYHPILPPDPSVEIIKVKRNRILVAWKHSLSSRNLEYCVSSNHRGNYNTLCAAHNDHPHSEGMPGSSVSCVGQKTWHLFKGLQRGKTYYFDVYVRDRHTNASSTYVGVSATLRGEDHPTSRVKDDSLATFTLDETNGYAVNTKYHVGKTSASILVFVQSCTGPGPVNLHISKSGPIKRDVMSTTVMDAKTLELPREASNSSASLALSIQSTTSHPRQVRLWISSRRHSLPFPVLPQDKSVRVFDTLTTCDSITIGWKTTQDERVKYCIYRQAARDELMMRTLAEPQNFCEPQGRRNPDRKVVLCRRYHRFNKQRFNNLIMQKVKGLHPGTRYLFEVQVTKVKGLMLPYEQVWAMTDETCSNSRGGR